MVFGSMGNQGTWRRLFFSIIVTRNDIHFLQRWPHALSVPKMNHLFYKYAGFGGGQASPFGAGSSQTPLGGQSAPGFGQSPSPFGGGGSAFGQVCGYIGMIDPCGVFI